MANEIMPINLPEPVNKRQADMLAYMLAGDLAFDAATKAGYEAPHMVAYYASIDPRWRDVCEASKQASNARLNAIARQSLHNLVVSAERETVRLDAAKFAIQLTENIMGQSDDAPKDMEQLARQVLRTIDTLPEKAVPIQAATSGAIDAAMPVNLPSKHGRRAKRKQ